MAKESEKVERTCTIQHKKLEKRIIIDKCQFFVCTTDGNVW